MSGAGLDLVVRGGLVFDGSGSKPSIEDLAIRGRTIVARSSISGEIPSGDAPEVRADGMWVTPGFLDIHTHYDAELEAQPGLQESVRHGVTTIVMGNCSISMALGSSDEVADLFTRVETMPRELINKWLADRITWRTTGEYYDHLERDVAMGPNVASFVGHSNIRIASMGIERALNVANPEKSESDQMDRHLTEALDAGYLGMSIDMLPMHRMDGNRWGGEPLPSQRALRGERRRLANIIRRHGAVLQGAPNAVATSVFALLSMSASYFVRKPLRTTIVAAVDVRRVPWGHRAVTFLTRTVNALFRANVRFQALADRFRVYSDGATNPIFEEFPTGAAAIGATAEKRRELFRDPEFRKDFCREWRGRGGTFHRRLDEMHILNVPGQPEWAGKSFADVAAERDQDPLEFFMDIVAEHNDDVRWVTNIGNHRPKVRRRLLSHPATLPGFSDAGAHARSVGFQDSALQLLKEADANPGWMSPQAAVARLTGEPAKWLGLDVGTLDEGARADVVILDPSKLQTGLSDEAVEQRPDFMDGSMRMVRKSDGVVQRVIIGGKSAFSADDGFDPALGNEPFGSLLRTRR